MTVIAPRRLLFAGAVLAATGLAFVGQSRGDLFGASLTDAQQVITNTRINHGDMTVTGTVDRRDATYNPGQPIALSVRTSKNAFVVILRVLPNGDTAIVFPNRAHRSAAITADTALTVPGPGETAKITANKPGLVLFEFIASSTNAGNSWLFTRPPDSGSDFADLGGTTRQIAKDLISTLKIGAGHDTAASYLTVRISGGGLF